MNKTFVFKASFDQEAGVFWAQCDDLPGLVTEAETLDALSSNIASLLPEYFELNGIDHDGGIPPVHLMTEVLQSRRSASG